MREAVDSVTACDDVIEQVAKALHADECGCSRPPNEAHERMARAVYPVIRDAVLDEVIATVDASPAVTWAGSGGAKERIRGMKGGTE